MNSLTGQITEITVNGSMSLVAVTIGAGMSLKSIVIDTPETAPYLHVGNTLMLLFKATEVVIGKELQTSISIQNQIPGKVMGIVKGRLLSKIVIMTAVGEIVSIIGAETATAMELKKGTVVVAMIKLNEIMLSEC